MALTGSLGCHGADSEESQPAPRLLSTVGHGAFFTSEGEAVERPTLADIEHTQEHLVRELEPDARGVSAGLIFASVDDAVVGRAIYIDELIGAARPPNRANLGFLNGAMRNYYLFEIRQDPRPGRDQPWYRGVAADTAALLESNGIELLTITGSSGADYVDECRFAGVPVPDRVNDPSEGWVNRGNLNYPFLNFVGADNEIWSWESSDPPGICLSLPRWSGGSTGLFGLICLNSTTGKTCFFDGDQSRPGGYARGASYSIDELVGGTTLAMGTQFAAGGMCTDCHAGENPFNVHPEMFPFDPDPTMTTATSLYERGVLRSGVWVDPIVPLGWLENPGPLAGGLPEPSTADQGRCDSCHYQGNAGRFPALSSAFKEGYCKTVLRRAIFGPRPGDPPTMPPGFATPPPEGVSPLDYYADHIEYLLMLCETDPSGGFVEGPGPEDDPDFLSRPTVEQMYLCADRIEVSRTRFRGEVRLLLGGTPVTEPKTVDPTSAYTVFTLSEIEGVEELDTTQSWTAEQRVDGGPWSDESEPPVSPKSYRDDFDGGLRPPQIAFTPLYDCGQALAVTGYVPGATIHVERTGGADYEYVAGAGTWSGSTPATRFNGDPAGAEKVRVGQSFCAEEPVWSDLITVSPEPSSFGPAAVPNMYDQQELIAMTLLTQGTTQTLTSSAAGALPMLGSYPAHLRMVDIGTMLGRPLSGGETIQVYQQLCDRNSTGISAPARSCDLLPAVEIVQPRPGDTEVRVVGDLVPGSTILVWSVDRGREIGDSSGGVINLQTPPLVGGETLQVMQQLSDSCRAARHFEITVL